MSEPPFWRKVGIYFGVADFPEGHPERGRSAEITVRGAVGLVIAVVVALTALDLLT